MLRPDDLISFIKSFRKLLQTEDWEALVTVIIIAGAIGYVLSWVYYRFLRRLRRRESADAMRPIPPATPEPLIGQLRGTINQLETTIEGLQPKIAALEVERDRLTEQLRVDQDVLDRMLTNEGEIWRMHQARPPHAYTTPFSSSRPKILMVANNKGGVGKTTLTAYLIMFFLSKGKRVLAIDVDYQGSLTGWMLSAGGITIPNGQEHRLSLANRLLTGELFENWPAEVLGDQVAGTQLITADYTLTQHETALMLRWLRQQGQPDIRYYLAEVLLGRHVQNSASGFDIVLIDAPPRLTTGAVNALVASTHLLVPTKLDPLSAETVRSFLKQATALRSELNLDFELAGVVGTMTPARPLERELGRAEIDAQAIVRRGLTEWPRERYVFRQDIQELADMRNVAGRRIAYFDKAAEMFERFGAELSGRMGV